MKSILAITDCTLRGGFVAVAGPLGTHGVLRDVSVIVSIQCVSVVVSIWADVGPAVGIVAARPTPILAVINVTLESYDSDLRSSMTAVNGTAASLAVAVEAAVNVTAMGLTMKAGNTSVTAITNSISGCAAAWAFAPLQGT